MKNIAIIGAGPAGIFSTLLLEKFAGQIVLFDQNKKIGEKLRITGGGRMNVTNKIFSADEFSSTTERALKNLFKSPWVKKREEILEDLGVEYVWEKNRAILESGDANAEVERLAEKIFRQKNASFYPNALVESVEKKGEKFVIGFDQSSEKKSMEFDAVILSGGGMFRMFSRVKANQIYELPQQIGHEVTGVNPSLSPIRIKNNPFKDLSGTPMVLELSETETKKKMTQDAIFTHMGLSGPVVLDFSAHLPVSGEFSVNFLPEISDEAFTKKFNDLRQGKNLVRNLLRQFMPKKIADWHLENLKIKLDANISDVPKQTLKDLRKNLFRYVVTEAKTFDYAACWTTRGGVSLTDINVSTLESKKSPGVYFAGEILDVNGLCGGFNISFAAISAKIVSESVLKNS